MNKKSLYNIGITIFAILIPLSCASFLFAAQSEIISLTVSLNENPEIIEIQPPDGSIGYTPDYIKFTVDAHDEGDLLYRFSCDGQIICPWQNSNEFTWSTEGVSFGIHTIKLEVKDANGGADFQEIELCLFIKPPALPLP